MLIKIQFPNLGVCAHMPNNIIPFFFFFFWLVDISSHDGSPLFVLELQIRESLHLYCPM